jgi:hypothetical protein
VVLEVLASQSIPTWNHLHVWLREMEALRKYGLPASEKVVTVCALGVITAPGMEWNPKDP